MGMHYLDDFLDDDGFDYGMLPLTGKEEFREVYCQAINTLAVQLGSEYRALAVDTDQINGCRIWFALKEDMDALDPAWSANSSYMPDLEHVEHWRGCDEAMIEAVAQLLGPRCDLDHYVNVTVEIRTDFDNFLETLRPALPEAKEME